MKKILLVTTGGTIASFKDAGSGVVPSLSGDELIQGLDIEQFVSIDKLEFSKVPSQYLNFSNFLELSKKIDESNVHGKYDGVVVTMGTNIIEEAAYFLDLTVESRVPIVVTGAMRNPSLFSSDAKLNLHDSIIAASSELLENFGTVVVANQEIHHSRYVAKTNTTSFDTFKSPNSGPIGHVRGNRVILYAIPAQQRKIIKPNKISARVDLIKYCMGMDGSLLEAAVGLRANGIVIEAFGGGHLMLETLPAIGHAIGKGIPVVMTSRCPAGELLENTYGFEGGEVHLKKMGVIFASGYSGLKARVKLLLELSAGFTLPEIMTSFEK